MLSKMQKSYIEQNAQAVRKGEMDVKVLAKEVGVGVKVLKAYLATLPEPAPPPLSKKIGDFAVGTDGRSVSMTEAQANRADTPSGGQKFMETRLKNAIFKPRKDEPSH